jgi:hypothetical protein
VDRRRSGTCIGAHRDAAHFEPALQRERD